MSAEMISLLNSSLATVLFGAIITGIVQVSRKYLPKVNPLVWVAVLSLIMGMIYSFVLPSIQTYFSEEVMERIWFGFASAVAIYEILKQTYQGMSGKDDS
jgi:uncharacterized membrane protein YfcA